ncbi:MAG TPA: YggS family pyridoxal phosphate-dependent enzyme [Candidatus Acidoferrales bacterium]|nr:YggS family pyridoxal phosphate-dependent enzyme [Candidatus Acidoferrales bacterium]
MVDVAANCRRVMANIRAAAARSGRDPREVKLLAACKSHGLDAIRAAVGAGVRLLGENYVQEAKPKIAAIEGPVEWHLIGRLQRNKARQALELFSVIESLDSMELARLLDREAGRKRAVCRAFIEVNLGEEQTKAGVSENQLPAFVDELGGLANLRIEGLMTIPPFFADPERTRPYFRRLKYWQSELSRRAIPNVEPRELSMGMTNDYEVAVEEGATIVRIGTAIFGERRR